MHKIIILVVACLLLFSCASKTPKKSENPGDIYVEGVNYLKMKKYDKAIDDFSYIRENFPFDPISFIASVKLGDVYFAKKEYILASGVYEDFFNTHPEDENIPYVLTRLGECYEKLSLSFDRDQAYTLKAIERYVYLKNRFPASSYTKDTDLKLKILSQKLADRELYVGEFYYRTDQYNASILRLEYFLKKFSYAKGIDKALYYLSMSYRAIGNFQKGDFYSDILKKEYPKSLFAKAAARERRSLQLAKADKALPIEGTKKKEIELEPQPIKTKAEEQEGKLAFFDETKPIDIVSDTMEGFDKEKYVIFKGSVIARQEDLFIFSDIIEAHMNEVTNEIEKAYAKGNVKIVKKERTATCNEAEFNNTKAEIILKGNVIVYSGLDKLTGEIVTYYVDEDRVVVEGEKEKKAHITVTPK
ncbi:MAG: outer membrane protein assembly factor BamD [Proteobacteria bacterium]|nr:outer membrane protein assembly factor BamD [Pseudomonadota bacterium]